MQQVATQPTEIQPRAQNLDTTLSVSLNISYGAGSHVTYPETNVCQQLACMFFNVLTVSLLVFLRLVK